VRRDLDVVVGDGEAGELAEGAADVDLDHAAAPGVRQVGVVEGAGAQARGFRGLVNHLGGERLADERGAGLGSTAVAGPISA
jgi:hypothetical protein